MHAQEEDMSHDQARGGLAGGICGGERGAGRAGDCTHCRRGRDLRTVAVTSVLVPAIERMIELRHEAARARAVTRARPTAPDEAARIEFLTAVHVDLRL